jgi:hypothetical protein
MEDESLRKKVAAQLQPSLALLTELWARGVAGCHIPRNIHLPLGIVRK